MSDADTLRRVGEIEQKCEKRGDHCQGQFRTIFMRLATTTTHFVALKGEVKSLWAWKRAQNSHLLELRQDVKNLDEKMDARLEKLSADMMAKIGSALQAFTIMQVQDARLEGEGIGKNKVAEGIIKYGGAGAALALTIWRLIEVAAKYHH